MYIGFSVRQCVCVCVDYLPLQGKTKERGAYNGSPRSSELASRKSTQTHICTIYVQDPKLCVV